MKLLLDNCVPYRVKRLFAAHDVRHASDEAWEALRNGVLIAHAASGAFDALVTTDKKIRKEQNLPKLPLPILELNTRLTKFVDLIVLQPYLETALAHTTQFLFVSVKPDGTFELLAPRPPSPPTTP